MQRSLPAAGANLSGARRGDRREGGRVGAGVHALRDGVRAQSFREPAVSLAVSKPFLSLSVGVGEWLSSALYHRGCFSIICYRFGTCTLYDQDHVWRYNTIRYCLPTGRLLHSFSRAHSSGSACRHRTATIQGRGAETGDPEREVHFPARAARAAGPRVLKWLLRADWLDAYCRPGIAAAVSRDHEARAGSHDPSLIVWRLA